MKDTLTAATGAVVPFHHSLLDEGGVNKLVLGYAHCGMVAAARWIAKSITPSLREAVRQCPDYQIKVHALPCFMVQIDRVGPCACSPYDMLWMSESVLSFCLNQTCSTIL
jgi:hypothetical protein